MHHQNNTDAPDTNTQEAQQAHLTIANYKKAGTEHPRKKHSFHAGMQAGRGEGGSTGGAQPTSMTATAGLVMQMLMSRLVKQVVTHARTMVGSNFTPA